MRAMFYVYLFLIIGGISSTRPSACCTTDMRRFLRDNSLSIVFLLLFLAALSGQAIAGHVVTTTRHVAGRYVVSSDYAAP